MKSWLKNRSVKRRIKKLGPALHGLEGEVSRPHVAEDQSVERRINKLGSVMYQLEGNGARVFMSDGSAVANTWKGRKALQDVGLCTPVANDPEYVEAGNDWLVR